MASIAYGEPRLTNDIDIVADIRERDISRGVCLSKREVDETADQMAQAPTASMDALKFYLSGHKKLEKAIELDPQFALPYHDLSSLRFGAAGSASVEALRKARELAIRGPEKDRMYIESDYAWRLQGDHDKRLRILQEIAAKYPKEKDVHLVLTALYSGRGMFPEAIAEAEKGLALDPRWSAMLIQLGFVYINAGDPAKGEETLKRAVEAAPGEPKPLATLGDISYRNGILNDAVEYYQQALRIKPDYGCEERIAYIQAIEAYRKLIIFDPKGPDRRMHNPVYHYRLAKLYESKGLKEQARAEYQRLLEDWKDADPGIPELVDTKARLAALV